MNDPDIKQNPHPTMRYDVTITIEGAPGPFDSVDGIMQYEVTNLACVPKTGGPMNAMRIPPKAWPRITFNKVSDNIYKGTAYGDYFKDEDYFGLGVCHWSLIAARAELKVNKLTLVSYLSPEQLFSQQTVPSYFVREDYDDNQHERSSSGETHLTDYLRSRPQSVFSITLTAKESAQ
ncbi:hypothetical protein EKH79_01655 [Dyella dinghuensis]|uniref:Uncharacterized protein n=1 Tax=Dyella dinghuensis TaxID=1920169 RepID=A0A432LX83_9GAMM|nr:hypothetical protein [Dyella dinghuensis]RUL66557.1 hypothetical protein EKH79_01655 [Dyella dinghuensis]